MNKTNIKELLITKLKNDKVDITNIDLDEIIYLYNYYVDYALAKYYPDGEVTKDKFNFINVLSSEYDNDDYSFYNFLINIIEIKKRGFIKYFDDILMSYVMKVFSTHPIAELLDFSNFILKKIHNGRGHNIPTFFSKNNDIALAVICGVRYGFLIESTYVSEDYKKIASTFKDLLSHYCGDNWYYFCYHDKKKIDWITFINYIYIFFVTNNLFNDEFERVNKFLDYLKTNADIAYDGLELNGINDFEKIVIYINMLYNEFDQRVKVIL